MDKRTFLKRTLAAMGGSLMTPFIPPVVAEGKVEPLTNWAGNVQYSTDHLFEPTSVEQVQEVVRKCAKLRGLGTRHSFNRIADSRNNQISVRALHKLLSVDPQGKTVTVEGGISYGQLCPELDKKGYALHNLASLPHISIAGACSTATHGSGVKNGNLATAVRAIEFVNAEGELVRLSRDQDGDRFEGAVVGLGGLGIITKLTLDVQPTYSMRQAVYQHMPLKELTSNFDAIENSGYSVSLFTDWTTQSINQVWIKSRVEEGGSAPLAPEFYGAKLATKNLHPLENLSAENCTEQMGVPGPWYERLPHFRMGFTPSSGHELQSEYFVPAENAVDAILAVYKISDAVSPHLLISEIRTIAADRLWMSPCYRQASVTIHFTWKPDWPAVKAALAVVEPTLAPFRARPHWGKLFTMRPAHLQSLIVKLPDFKQLLQEYDPKAKFRNGFLSDNLYEVKG
jgi:xylitol oxidase